MENSETTLENNKKTKKISKKFIFNTIVILITGILLYAIFGYAILPNLLKEYKNDPLYLPCYESPGVKCPE